MKKNQTIINRVEQYEYKRGITYIKSSGKFFGALKIFFSVFFVWAFIMNFLTVLSWSLKIGTELFKSVSNTFYTLLFFTALSLLGYIFSLTKLKLIGIFISIFSSIFTVIVYAPLLKDATTTLGYKTIFFTRHLIPHTAIVIVSLMMLLVLVISYFKFTNLYKKIEKTLYEEYKTKKETENIDITWEEYLDTI
ncbi:MAG: hypothetical protein E7561_01330 [Ruminococcaceae bacterium]|nr:hypothetical protein [Oscillospiraceae bacterium]